MPGQKLQLADGANLENKTLVSHGLYFTTQPAPANKHFGEVVPVRRASDHRATSLPGEGSGRAASALQIARASSVAPATCFASASASCARTQITVSGGTRERTAAASTGSFPASSTSPTTRSLYGSGTCSAFPIV